MNKFFIILIFLTISCKKNTVNTENETFKKLEDDTFVYILNYKKAENNSVKLDDLKVIEKKSKKFYQIINLRKNDLELPENISYFTIQDVNFDGINDIEIVNFVGAYTSKSSFWIYDRTTNQFIHYKKLDDIENPVIIKDRKEICSFWHAGVSEFHLEKYFWNDENLLQLKENYEEFWSSENRGNLKISTFQKGKWIISEKNIKEHFIENMKCE